jgi:HAD superfamily phosphoserine phosphatase-like hydrolase
MGVNRVNVYDFDGTIYNGDSSVDIYFFLLKRYPKLIAFFPKQMLGIVKYKLHLSSKEEMKEMYFSFLKGVRTDKTFVDDFWKQNQNKIKEWYLKQKRKDDVIISASPEFLLKPICDILGIDNLIATKVELSSGKFLSKNCQGAEKVVRFEEIFSEAEIEAFYFDSKSDTYMAKLATKAFLIKNNRIIDWEQG